MADTRISELTALSGADVAATDEFVVVDKSDTTMAASGTDKRVVASGLPSIPALANAFATTAQGAKADAALPRAADGASVENVGAIESNVSTVAATGATETLDTSVYAVFDLTMDQSCTLTFSNPAPSGKATIFTVILRGAFTVTWPASVDWGNATAPTYTTPSMYVFTTVDGGTTWFGAQVGKAFG